MCSLNFKCNTLKLEKINLSQQPPHSIQQMILELIIEVSETLCSKIIGTQLKEN